MKRSALILVSLFLFTGICFPSNIYALHKVFAKEGSIYFATENKENRLTQAGLNKSPVIHPSGKWIYFIKTTGAIDDGEVHPPKGYKGGYALKEEIWRMDTTGKMKTLIYKSDESPEPNQTWYSLSSIDNIQFSPDGKKIYFESNKWVTSNAVHVMESNGSNPKMLGPGNGLSIIKSNNFKQNEYMGYLVVRQHRYLELGGSDDRYWLFDPDFKEIGPIGDTLPQGLSFFNQTAWKATPKNEPMFYDDGWKTLSKRELTERIQRPVLNINNGELFNFKVVDKNNKEVGRVKTPAEYYQHIRDGNELYVYTTYDIIDEGGFKSIAMPLLYLSKAKTSKQSYVKNFPFDNEDPLFVLPVDFVSWRGSDQREILEKASAKNRPWRYVSPNARVIASTKSDLRIYDTFAEDLYNLPKEDRYNGDQASHIMNPVVLGDLNNDGYEDIVLDCAHYNVEGSGRSYSFVVLTRTSPNDTLKDITKEVDKLIWKEPTSLDSNNTIKRNNINRSIKASDAELSPRQIEIIQTILNPNGHISQELHSEFWGLMPAVLRNNKQAKHATVNFIEKNFVFSIQFNQESFASMKASIEAGRVVKTPGYNLAKENFYTSFPLPARQKIQKSIDNTEGMIKAAAEAKPFQSKRGTIYITLEMVNQVIAGLDEAFTRARRLMNPEWGNEIKVHQSDVLPKQTDALSPIPSGRKQAAMTPQEMYDVGAARQKAIDDYNQTLEDHDASFLGAVFGSWRFNTAFGTVGENIIDRIAAGPEDIDFNPIEYMKQNPVLPGIQQIEYEHLKKAKNNKHFNMLLETITDKREFDFNNQALGAPITITAGVFAGLLNPMNYMLFVFMLSLTKKKTLAISVTSLWIIFMTSWKILQ